MNILDVDPVQLFCPELYRAAENTSVVSASNLCDTWLLIEHLGKLLKTLILCCICHFYIIILRGAKHANATQKPFRVLTRVLFFLGTSHRLPFK